MKKRLSIIIPGYNTPYLYWDRCIKSVINVCGQNDEVICIDDASQTDNSFDKLFTIIKDNRIKLIKLKENTGAAGARNIGLTYATGEYVTFVDSDDEVIDDIYEQAISVAKINNSDIVIFGVKVIWTKEKLYKNDIPSSKNFHSNDYESLKNIYDLCLFEYPVNKIYKKEFLDNNNIKFQVGICPGEDTVFNLDCFNSKSTISTINRIGYIYYKYDGSSLTRYFPNLRNSLEIRTLLWKKFKNNEKNGVRIFGKIGEFDENSIIQYEWENLWRLGSKKTWKEKIIFLNKNKEKIYGGYFAYIIMIIKTIIRKYLYINIIRRWKIKSNYPNALELE